MWSEEAEFGGQVTLFGLLECGQRKLTYIKPRLLDGCHCKFVLSRRHIDISEIQ